MTKSNWDCYLGIFLGTIIYFCGFTAWTLLESLGWAFVGTVWWFITQTLVNYISRKIK